MNAEMKPEYKQTEVGLLPESWTVKSIAGCMRLLNGRAFKPSEWASSGLPIIRIQNLNNPLAEFNYYPLHDIEYRHRIKPGDLLFAWSGTLGSSFGARRWQGPEGVLNQHIFKVIPDEKFISPEYAHVVFKRIEDDIAKKAHGFKTSFVHIKKSDLDNTLLPIPCHQDQQAIASALYDIDTLLGSMDQLIAKKRDIQQAAMQQLLTGQRRLPGFSGEWEVKRLGDCLLANPDYGINAPAVAYSDALPTYIRITDINDDGYFAPLPRVSVDSPMSSDYLLEEGDVVFARTGASVGKSYRYRADDGPLVFAGFLIRVRPNQGKLIPAFLAASITTKSYWNWVRLMSMRSGQPGINANEYASLSLRLPSIEEQTAIANALSEMAAELTALETRRGKARQLKQGMMQELLTGRIRLR